VADLSFPVENVYGNNDDAQLYTCEKYVEEFDAIRKKETQPISARYAPRIEQSRNTIAPRVEFAKS